MNYFAALIQTKFHSEPIVQREDIHSTLYSISSRLFIFFLKPFIKQNEISYKNVDSYIDL